MSETGAPMVQNSTVVEETQTIKSAITILMPLKELMYKQTTTTNFRRVWNDGARQPVVI